MNTAKLIPLGALPDGTTRCVLDARGMNEAKISVEQNCSIESYLNQDGKYALFLDGPIRAKKGQVVRVSVTVRLGDT